MLLARLRGKDATFERMYVTLNFSCNSISIFESKFK